MDAAIVIIVVVRQQFQTMAAAASVALGRWRTGVDGLMARVASAFVRVESRRRARSLVLGLMARLDRRNCWTLAEAAGQPNPYGFQHLLSRAKWDDTEVRARLRAYVDECLPSGNGPRVLVVDETGDVKKGTCTVGVQRQYSGTAGRIENCQIAVYTALACSVGHAAIDVRLYMPQQWIGDPARLDQAGVPADVGFATKPELGWDMIMAAVDTGVRFDYVTADEAYGDNPTLRKRLLDAGLAHVLAVARTNPVTTPAGQKSTAQQLIARIPHRAWRTHSAGDGANGRRLYRWASVEIHDPAQPGGHACVMARRNRRTGEIAYYRCWTPNRVGLQQLVRVAGMRWRIEETFQGSKALAALDEHQVRTWTSWHRWTTLAMLAYAFLAITRLAETNPSTPDDETMMIPLTCNEIRHLLTASSNPEIEWEHRISWSLWRRRHQATAKRCHYQRQQALTA